MLSGAFRTRVVKVDPAEPDPAVIEEAATLLRAGEVIAIPTETVYGLAADGLNEKAVAKIFALKERPADRPLVLFVSDPTEVERLTKGMSDKARQLIRAFWPGPLTIVLRRAEEVSRTVTAGGETVGIRCPDDAVARELARVLGRPLATSSANISGAEAPRDAAGVMRQLGGKIPMILDGGPTRIGIPSTVVDLTVDPAAIVREGAVGKERLQKYIREDSREKPNFRRRSI